jgi:hypothetical protein
MAIRLTTKCPDDLPFCSAVNIVPLGPFAYGSDTLLHYFTDIDDVYPHLRISVRPQMR